MKTSESGRLAAPASWEKMCCLLLVVGTLVYYWTVFFHYRLNAGQADDFVDVLWFYEIFSSRENGLDKLAVLFLPNHEHVTLLNHLVYLADHVLFGKLDFFHYMLVGHLIVLASCAVLACWLRPLAGWWYAITIAVALFLNLFYWHAGFWAMTAVSNQAVILFALLAAYSSARHPTAILLPLLWALLATASQFNGILVLPALLVAHWWVRKGSGEGIAWRQSLVWLAAFVIVAAAYLRYENPFAADHLWRYVNYTDPEHLTDYVKPTGPALAPDLAHLLNIPLTFLSVAGASVLGQTQWMAAVALGLLLFAGLLFAGLLRSGRHSRVRLDRFWWTMLLFVVMSLGLVAVGRGLAFGPEAGLLYRYRLYSSLLLVLLVGGLLHGMSVVTVRRYALLLCLLVQLSSLQVLDAIAAERANVKISHYNWLIDGGMGRSQMPFYPHNQDWRLFNASAQGYYNPYEAIDAMHRPASVSSLDAGSCESLAGSDTDITGGVRAWSKKARALAVEIQVDIQPAASPLELLFCSDTAAYRVTLDSHNVDRSSGKYGAVLVLKSALPSAQYRVFWRDAASDYKRAGDVGFP